MWLGSHWRHQPAVLEQDRPSAKISALCRFELQGSQHALLGSVGLPLGPPATGPRPSGLPSFVPPPSRAPFGLTFSRLGPHRFWPPPFWLQPSGHLLRTNHCFWCVFAFFFFVFMFELLFMFSIFHFFLREICVVFFLVRVRGRGAGGGVFFHVCWDVLGFRFSKIIFIFPYKQSFTFISFFHVFIVSCMFSSLIFHVPHMFSSFFAFFKFFISKGANPLAGELLPPKQVWVFCLGEEEGLRFGGGLPLNQSRRQREPSQSRFRKKKLRDVIGPT